MTDRLLGTTDIARHCGVTTETVVSWIKSGKLNACSTPGGRYRIAARNCIEFLKEYGMPVPEDWIGDDEDADQQTDEESSHMNQLVLPKTNVPRLVDNLRKSYRVFGPVPRGNSSAFVELDDAAELQLDYTTTILPPKKLVLPAQEELLEFNTQTWQAREPEPDTKPVAALGVHPCDMQGILRLDFVFRKGQAESNYFDRRDRMLFIGTSCNPDESCFCSAVGTNKFDEGFDLFLTDIGQSYLVSILTDRGREVLKGLGTKAADEIDLNEMAKARERCSTHAGGQMQPSASTLPLLAKDGEDAALWEDIGSRCLACGTCNLVCPTCYCFDVRDELNLDLKSGKRSRFWDSCQLDEFAEVAGGESFRKERSNRQKHRFNRKFRYLAGEYGAPFCVGCGRCIRQCVAKISILETANDLEKAVANL
ncbi:MAG: 4Fe-4S dicluster domain-containing protein [Planctomycetes bacterium]|nr:4Fe-4S dicluster domain-containing protein [Planctomycetota bacterium]